MTPRPRAYRVGAYAIYPSLAAGGALLSRADSGVEYAAATGLMGDALALPVAVMTALAFRTPLRNEQ